MPASYTQNLLLGILIFAQSQYVLSAYCQETPVSTVPEAVVVTEEKELPLLSEFPLPTTQALLEGEARDWIVLIGGRVLTVPQLWPRPDHLEWLEREQKKLSARRPTNPEFLPEWLEEYKRFNSLIVEVADEGVEADYSLPVRFIDRIIYHEQLMLNKAQELIAERELTEAYRLLSGAARRIYGHNQRRIRENLPAASWPSLQETERLFLIAEVKQAHERQQWETAFHRLLNYAESDAEFDQIPLLMEITLQQWGRELFDRRDYRELRYALQVTGDLYPELSSVKNWTERLQELAEQTMQAAEEASGQKDLRTASLLGQISLQIWPRDNELRRRWQPLQAQYPILRVGLLAEYENRSHYEQHLLRQSWLQIESLREGYPRYGSRFLESWQPADLGRTINYTFRTTPQPMESQPQLRSSDLSAAMQAAVLPADSNQRGLFTNTVQRWETISPLQLQLQLENASPHPFAWQAAMFAHAPVQDNGPLANSPFHRDEKLPEIELFQPTFRAVRSTPQLPRRYPLTIVEVQNHVFNSRQELLQGLLRDQLDYLPDLPVEMVQNLREDRRFVVHRYQLPRIVALQFHLHGQLAAQPELRLALLTLLDRARLLREVAPEASPARAVFRLTDSLLPQGSHASLKENQSIAYDPIAGLSLYTIATRQQSASHRISTLRLSVPQEEELQRVGHSIRKEWEKLGLQIDLISETDTPDEAEATSSPAWDLRLVSYQMLAPVHELPALLTDSGRVSQRDLEQMPLSIRQPLLTLETAQTWQQANEALYQLQQRLTGESWMLPVWEQDQFGVLRREVQNVPQQFLRSASQIDRWIITPVIPGF